MRPTLSLYSKPGCHLCADLRTLLDELQAEFDYAIEEVDITTDDALFARYRHEIPVLLMNGEELGRGRIDESQLRVLLEEGHTQDT